MVRDPPRHLRPSSTTAPWNSPPAWSWRSCCRPSWTNLNASSPGPRTPPASPGSGWRSPLPPSTSSGARTPPSGCRGSPRSPSGCSVQDVDQRPSEPVDAPHHNGVTRLGVIEKLFHARPPDRGAATGDDIGEHIASLDPGRDQRIELQLRVLAGCTDACIAKVSHPVIVARKGLLKAWVRRPSMRRRSKTSADLE